jgi:lysyl-tRNA synthetase class 2
MSTWKELRDNPRLFEIYKQRTEIIKLVRQFFWSKEFFETDVPVAVKFPSQEPYLHFIPLTIHDPVGKEEYMYLTTSPEFSLKKLLAAGFSNIFSITKCFRDYEEFGRTHNTEFTMIEWYRAPGMLVQIMDDTEELFKFVGKSLGKNIVEFNSKKISITESWERVTMKELWKKYVGVDLDGYLEIEKLRNLVQELGYQIEKSDLYEDLFFKIFLNKIEPYLGVERPTFVYEYPRQLCSLSRVSERDARYAERFELYVGGLEVANAFGELTDAIEQRKRLEEDRELRKKLDKEVWDVDEDFIQALESGIPSLHNIQPAFAAASARHGRKASGIALGIDRMVVLFTGAHDINEVIFGSIADQVTEK